MIPDSGKVAEVLEKAAEVIETRGHTKEQYVNANGAVCAMGAIRTAAWGRVLYLAKGITEEQSALHDRAAIEVGRHLAREGCNVVITEWNDAPDRTGEEVVDTFKLVAKDLRNRARPA